MPSITVTSLQNPTSFQKLQTNQLLLKQPSIVDLAIDQNQIAQVEHVGPRLLIVLKNGEQIVIDNFFAPDQTTPHTLLLLGGQATKLQANFDKNAKLIDYSPYDQGKETIQNQTQPTIIASKPNTDQATIANTATETETEENNGPSFLKAGLALVGLEAAYLLAFNNDKKSGSNNPPDHTPPTITSGAIDDDGKIITGKTTEPDIKVYAVNQDGENIGETFSDAEGNFTLNLSEAVINGALVIIKATDKSGNESKVVTLKGTKDTIPPTEANAQINDQGVIISGKAEPNAKVKIFDIDGKTVIAGPVYAAKDGSFSITLKNPLKHGEKAQVLVEDDAGNPSKMVTVEVGKDTLAPEQPLIEVATDGGSIKGIAEAETKVNIFDSHGQLIGSGQSDANGQFNIKITPALAEKESASIVIEDTAGNKSSALNFKAGDDTIAPDSPVATINTDGNLISGTAEANSKIEVYNLQGSVIGTATTDADGKFSLTLKTALVNNAQAKIYAIDHAGNKSPALDLVGHKDTIPPAKAILKTVTDHAGETTGVIKAGEHTDDARPVFEGTGEANAILTIYNHGFAIGTVTVSASGTWSFKPETDLAFGKQELSFTQMDAGNNTSDMSDSFQFNIVAPQTASLVDQLLTPYNAQYTTVAAIQSDNLYHLTESTELKTDLAQLLTTTTTFIV